MDTNEEIWKDIKGYEGYYQVSNLGRVRSLDRTYHRKGRWSSKQGGKTWNFTYKGRILKPVYTSPNCDHPCVHLYKDSKRLSVCVSTLVKNTFGIKFNQM